MKVALIPNLTREQAHCITVKVCGVLRALGAEVYMDRQFAPVFPSLGGCVFLPEAQLYTDCDVIMPIGGDGSVLRAGKRAAENGKKILGVNAGNLAYLCGVDPEELGLLEKLVAGEYAIQRRMLLDALDGLFAGIGGQAFQIRHELIIIPRIPRIRLRGSRKGIFQTARRLVHCRYCRSSHTNR